MKIAEADMLNVGDTIYQWGWHFDHWDLWKYTITGIQRLTKGPRVGRKVRFGGDKVLIGVVKGGEHTPYVRDEEYTGMSLREAAYDWDLVRTDKPSQQLMDFAMQNIYESDQRDTLREKAAGVNLPRITSWTMAEMLCPLSLSMLLSQESPVLGPALSVSPAAGTGVPLPRR